MSSSDDEMGALYINHQINSVAVCVYDATASQAMLAEHVEPPVAARFRYGPRSQLRHKNSHSYSKKHSFLRYRTPNSKQTEFQPLRVTNPHAPEFVPTTEPILNDEKLTNSETSSGAVTKPFHGNAGYDLDSTRDAEGFTVVTKRRKNRQNFTHGVNTGVYNHQHSMCASVR